MNYTTTHTIEIDKNPLAECSVSSLGAPAKAETNKMSILATLAISIISEARGEDNGMTMLDTELALEYLERISCGEKLTVKERVRIED